MGLRRILTTGLATLVLVSCGGDSDPVRPPPPRLNRAPVINTTSLPIGRESELYGFKISASDPDGDALSYSLPIAPAWLSISNTGLITGPLPEVISMDVEFEFIPTDQTFKQWGYGVAANVKERWRLRKGISKAREHKTGQFGNFVKKIISGP